MEKNKGITLITLVITIIVLLILAGISIGVLTEQNGMLNRTFDTRNKTEAAQEKEQIQIAIMAAMTLNDGKLTVKNLQQEVNTIFNSNDYTVNLSSGGFMIEKNHEQKYLIDENGEMKEYKNTIAYYIDNNEIKVGDYINYTIGDGNNTNNGQYKIEADITGHTSDQIYDVKKYNGKWQVMYDGSEGYGLQIISSSNILENDESSVLTLKGKNGYNNSIAILNKIAGYYINPAYASEARALGSNPSDNQNSQGEMEYATYDWGIKYDLKVPTSMSKIEQDKIINSKLFASDIWFACRDINITGQYVGVKITCFSSGGDKIVGKGVSLFQVQATTSNIYIFSKSNGVRPIIKLNYDLTMQKSINDDGDTVWVLND